MPKKQNLTIPLNRILDSKIRIGMKRHIAKQEYRDSMKRKGVTPHNLKTPYVHSIKTADNYREVINQFSRWIKVREPDIWKGKKIKNISKDIAYEYLRDREDKGLSPYSISRDMAAINKVLNLGLNKKEGELKKRHLKDIKRSRNNTNEGLSKTIKDDNKYQIRLAKATGMRRESMTILKPEDFTVLRNKALLVKLNEKGGKIRLAPILKKDQGWVASFLTNKKPGEKLFKNYSNQIDNHFFRACYAKERYVEMAERKLEIGLNVNKNYYYKRYDREIIRELSKNLGHNRLNVVVQHYSYQFDFNY